MLSSHSSVLFTKYLIVEFSYETHAAFNHHLFVFEIVSQLIMNNLWARRKTNSFTITLKLMEGRDVGNSSSLMSVELRLSRPDWVCPKSTPI